MKFDPTPLIRPNFYGPFVTLLTGLHCTLGSLFSVLSSSSFAPAAVGEKFSFEVHLFYIMNVYENHNFCFNHLKGRRKTSLSDSFSSRIGERSVTVSGSADVEGIYRYNSKQVAD